MNTSSEAIKHLQEAQASVQKALHVIDDLIAPHDYQDVALLVAQASAALIDATTALMESKDTAAFDHMERADDLLDEVYTIIDEDTDL